MIQLTDYLYNGDTLFHILHKYATDLQEDAKRTGNPIDSRHAAFLFGMSDMLEHNDFLNSQSQRIREFYKYMAAKYPHLAFTFRGRIKSLIRTEEKFNGYIVSYIYDYYVKNHAFPDMDSIPEQVGRFRDLIAYRIVLSMPKCHLREGDDREEVEENLLYEIADILPGFLRERGFTPEALPEDSPLISTRLDPSVQPYYKDYIEHPSDLGYRSLHIVFFDEQAGSYTEVQLRTKQMDDFAEIGDANHDEYEHSQEKQRSRRKALPVGACPVFDEAYERVVSLQNLDLSRVDVNMFSALDNLRINDGCGLYFGRLILPYEHLSRFQNDQID